MSLRSLRQELLERPDLHGQAFCEAYAAAADSFLASLLDDATRGDLHGLALVAVGGYGRRELSPFSDLDVVLVHHGRRDITRTADAVWYPVWDEGVRLDHSVRRPSEVIHVVREDLRAQLGWLDARLVAGDEKILEPLLEKTLQTWRDNAHRWLPGLADQVEERHRSNGDVAFLLEPDLKESHGGLRDSVVVEAMVKGVPTLGEHVDVSSMARPKSILGAARVELHRTTGRATDRLLLQEQDQVATLVGCRDADGLMSMIAEAGRTISWVSDDAWRRRALWDAHSARRRRRRGHDRNVGATDAQERRIEQGLSLSVDPSRPEYGEVVLGPGARPEDDLTLTFRTAAVAAEQSVPISRGALQALAERAPALPDPWPEEVRTALVRVLATGRPAIAALEALDQSGLLVRMLPEWGAVRNRPQRNAYHRFTVDRHLLETAAEAAPLALRVSRPDLLLVGALLHDIGKGYPGDHTEQGQTVMRLIARRMGFADKDVDTLVELVKYHLLLPDAATRRDLDDPGTIHKVATAVRDRTTLELLAALTEADSLATGPAAWGSWKAGLVADLVRRTEAVLAGEATPVQAEPLITDRHRNLMRQVGRLGRSIVVADGPKVTVVAGDRAGLFAAVTGVLALHGLDVRSANVASEGDYAVEVFTVESERARWPDWNLVSDELEAVLRGKFPLEDRLAERARTYAPRRRPLSARAPLTQVTFDNAASSISTVVEVRTSDSIGLLHRVTRALFHCELDVVAARVSTLGEEVVDAFYVRDGNLDDERRGRKIEDADRIREIDRQIHNALGSTSESAAAI
ncbi:MAG TPA: [protein-PII] uridylyltransferase [Acidimicrobiales bacterium]|nr:[protein-PII] uridylyltransferase [Acidimicrobiales bacterium]